MAGAAVLVEEGSRQAVACAVYRPLPAPDHWPTAGNTTPL